MGIIVTDSTLPSGLPVNNVYMSFGTECITIFPKNPEGLYTIQIHYKVYKDDTKQPNSDVRIPLTVQVSDISNIFQTLYENLKQIYPNSTDSLVNYAAPNNSADSLMNYTPPAPPAPEPTSNVISE